MTIEMQRNQSSLEQLLSIFTKTIEIINIQHVVLFTTIEFIIGQISSVQPYTIKL